MADMVKTLSKRIFPNRSPDDEKVDQNIVQTFSRLFPNLRPKRMADPARSSIMAAISNLGTYAFGAYDDPHVVGFVEETTSNNMVKHLKWDWVKNAMDGVFKITAHGAKNLRDSDGFGKGDSDPYCVFTTGGTYVKTEPKYDTPNPEWGSTHYLCVRKKFLEPESDAYLTVSVFDKDLRTGIGSVINWLDRDDYLGSVKLELSKLKKKGPQKMEQELKHPVRKQNTPSTVSFTLEYMTVEAAFKELDMDSESTKWLERDPTISAATNWPELSLMTDIGFIHVEKVAFIDGRDTGTQAWVHVNTAAKVLVVAFRGTEMTRLKDILADIRFLPVSVSAATRSDDYILKPTEALLDNDIRLHRGFRDAYDSVRESVLRIVYDLTGWESKWTLCITGHSLGGALATLCAFEMANRKLIPASTMWHSAMASVGMANPQMPSIAPRVGMMNFGAPRVGNATFVKLYNDSVRESLRIINANDLVHFLPPLGYRHTKFEVLLRPNGEVDIGGMTVQTGDYGEDINQQLETGEIEEEEIREKAFKMISVQKHLQPYYFEIVKSAVTKFFTRDRELRGRPMRILRTRGIGGKAPVHAPTSETSPEPTSKPTPQQTSETAPEASSQPTPDAVTEVTQ